MSSNDWKPETRAAQALHIIDAETGAVAPPIHPSVTFARDDNYELMGDTLYSRYGSPTNNIAERVIASLEGAEGSLTFASGLAASAAVIDLVKTGSHIVAPQIMYFGAQAWMKRAADMRGLYLTLYDQSDPDGLAAAIRPGETKLVWIETPTNPTFDVTDIKAAANLAHAAGALLMTDGTCAPPCTTRPLSLGADISFHSATKYLNGHSDVTAGVLSVKDPDLLSELDWIRCHSGAMLGAFEAWLLVRGMRTLYVRFERSCATAMTFARHFENHPAIEAVLYPGLESHPGHEIAKRQMTDGFSGMMSILVKGDYDAARKVASSVNIFVRATSLGGVESLIEHRRSIEGSDSVVPVNLIRISIGVEAVDDLIADLEQALTKI